MRNLLKNFTNIGQFRYDFESDRFTLIDIHNPPQTIFFTYEECEWLGKMSADDRINALFGILDTLINNGLTITKDLCDDYFLVHPILNEALAQYYRAAEATSARSTNHASRLTPNLSNRSQGTLFTTAAIDPLGTTLITSLNEQTHVYTPAKRSKSKRHPHGTKSKTVEQAPPSAQISPSPATRTPNHSDMVVTGPVMTPPYISIFNSKRPPSPLEVAINDELSLINFQLDPNTYRYDSNFYIKNREAIFNILSCYGYIQEKRIRSGHIIDFTHGIIAKNPINRLPLDLSRRAVAQQKALVISNLFVQMSKDNFGLRLIYLDVDRKYKPFELVFHYFMQSPESVTRLIEMGEWIYNASAPNTIINKEEFEANCQQIIRRYP